MVNRIYHFAKVLGSVNINSLLQVVPPPQSPSYDEDLDRHRRRRRLHKMDEKEHHSFANRIQSFCKRTLKNVVVGGLGGRFTIYAAAPPPPPVFLTKDEAKKNKIFLNRILTIVELRKVLFQQYDVAAMNDRDWFDNIFRRLPHWIVQGPLTERIRQEEEEGGDGPNEVEFLLDFGDGELIKDIQSTDTRFDFATFKGYKEDAQKASHMSQFLWAGDNHARVKDITIINPDSGNEETVSGEYTNGRYCVIPGLKDNDGKYHFHVILDQYLLVQVKRPLKTSEAVPLSLIGWWWWALDDRINDTRHNYEGSNDTPGAFVPFKSSDYMEFLAQLPLVRLTCGTYTFPLSEGEAIGSGYGTNYIPWEQLPHKNKEKVAETSYTEYEDQLDRSAFVYPPNIPFSHKHVLVIPGIHADHSKIANPLPPIRLNKVDDLLTLTEQALEILKSRKEIYPVQYGKSENKTGINTAIINEDNDVKSKLQEFNLNTDFVHGSLRQKHPSRGDNVVGVWCKEPANIVFREHASYMLGSSAPWSTSQDTLKWHFEIEKRKGGIVKAQIGRDFFHSDPNTFLGFTVERWFLAKGWRYLAWVDVDTDKVVHFDACWPTFVHKKWDNRKSGNWSHPGANGALGGGELRLNEEVARYIGFSCQFHNCDIVKPCGCCKKRMEVGIEAIRKKQQQQMDNDVPKYLPELSSGSEDDEEYDYVSSQKPLYKPEYSSASDEEEYV